MLKHETTFTWSEPIHGFDLMKWKNEVQTRIYEETKDLTTGELIEYFRQAGERADQRRADRAKQVCER